MEILKSRIVSSTLALVLACLLVASLPIALAITYGTPDCNVHHNTGWLVVEFQGRNSLICSGTLISPTVFLTAAHCVTGLPPGIGGFFVTFDSQFTQSSTLIPGTPHAHPDFNQRQSDPADIAVVVLGSAVGVSPATLPTAGLFDQLSAAGALKGQTFTAVGYGGLETKLGGGPPTRDFLEQRRVAVSTFNALNPAWLRLSQNPATGDGGTCYGDSGGPNFFGTSPMIAAITIIGDAMCRATNVVYRLDTPTARGFLVQYVTLP